MKSSFKFIDLFAGIGGFHIAMHNLGGECVFASEIDANARKTYIHNFSKISPELFESGNYNSDIRSIDPSEIPDFDILCGGFPCQPFSQAGLKRGFEDAHNSERGNLFFYIAEIIKEKKPKAFFLENVRGLLKHDNGKTLAVIQNILENELGYSFYYKIVQACDFGLPQLRPRLFMVGFRDESFMKSFSFPNPTGLKFTMSDVWEGNCTRDIGFTLRVGGRGSGIDDRRNWDHYLVDGEVKKIGSKEGKKMQGFPDDFEFPVSETQAMKQLGNSVAINAIQAVANNVVNHMCNLSNDINNSDNTIFDEQNITDMKLTKNKGEWSELFVFLKSLYDKKINFGTKDLTVLEEYIDINKVTNDNLTSEFLIRDNKILVQNKGESNIKETIFNEVIDNSVLNELFQEIKNGEKTFEIEKFNVIQSKLGISIVKGGNSNQKADINLSFNNSNIQYDNQGFGIKSYIGSKPTLLNASSNTNFIFKVNGLSRNHIDEINSINTTYKLKDRLNKIFELGGELKYVGAEKENMEFNLKMVDSKLPELIGEALISFYVHRNNSVKNVVELISDSSNSDDILLNTNIFKKFLVAILLGFFAGKKWNGEYEANGTLVLKDSGDLLAYHIIKLDVLKDYLFEHIKFDTPSTTRHMFGNLYQEKDGNLYFKLNMQLRF